MMEQCSSRMRWFHSTTTTTTTTTHSSSSTNSSSSFSSSSSSLLPNLRVQEEVQQALLEKKPIVALESTIVAHGMPYPQNWELAQDVESILRKEGVTPATIAIQNGIPCVGLDPNELHDLALSGKEGRAIKCSTRDLPLHMTQQQDDNKSITNSNTTCWGATTVASTMRLAHLAGIVTFVTGGIGGVHRHGESTMDISADLMELSRTPVIVVSAGIKSILDIPRTLEVLETYSVPTMSWQTNDFPAFFSPTSGVKSPARVDTAQQVADAFSISQQLLQLSTGMLVAIPNPDPANGRIVEDAIQQAVQEANNENIHGNDVTPYILKRVAETTQGISLKSNMALVRHNATIGAAIAKAIAQQ
ncbi:indigoidine synthase A family protein [Nitzschia inconspicua]|uniref:Indigoidine synthase A family protein n=1 Tax=Nitzschia inconspicua TaxID=303405 RepID=A0A9K3LWR3_9STRA|nr:indigoidine synthase A family protein [Nitzschia inconspicua]